LTGKFLEERRFAGFKFFKECQIRDINLGTAYSRITKCICHCYCKRSTDKTDKELENELEVIDCCNAGISQIKIVINVIGKMVNKQAGILKV
jgi:hypothetical protein